LKLLKVVMPLFLFVYLIGF